MALLDFKPKADLGTGLVIGAGLLLAPIVIPIIADAARPVLKAAVKGALTVYEKGREMIAEALEAAEDLIEEAKSEVETELAAAKE
jgi:hypothetical protein